ncbi:MAG: GspH/FimT family pseudopilin [Pseudomonadales bacterium]|nr:GspH/FimT family pseudopilin [Pseudomonadales bacterium]
MLANKQIGATLIEIISVLAIISVMTNMIAPSIGKIASRSNATASINWIIGAVNTSRHAAISFNVTTTLCPASDTALKCQGKWHEGIIIFADHNADASFNGSDYLIYRAGPDNIDGTLKWRSFGNRQYLQITQLGFTNYQNGNFTYCPHDQNLHFARQIVINVQGRARVVHTTDAQGLRTDRLGKLLRC